MSDIHKIVADSRIKEYVSSAIELFYADPANKDKPCPTLQAMTMFTLVHFVASRNPDLMDVRTPNSTGRIFATLLDTVCRQNNIPIEILHKLQSFYEADVNDLHAGRLG